MNEGINKIDICYESNLEINSELVANLLSKLHELFKEIMKNYDIKIDVFIKEKI